MDFLVVYEVIKVVWEYVVVGNGFVMIEMLIYWFGLYMNVGDDFKCYWIKDEE